MTLTRRDLITQAAALVGGASVVLASDSQPSPAPVERQVPTYNEVLAWEIRYHARYRAEHRARNQALVEHMAEPEPEALRIDRAVDAVEGGLDAALGLVQLDHDGIAKARGDGFGAARDGVKPESCPVTDDFDRFMAWHAGYLQSVLPKTMERARGYTPPPPYACPVCNVAEGLQHSGGCADQNPLRPDGLMVRRPPVRKPGVTFT